MSLEPPPDRTVPWLPLPGFVRRLTIAQRVHIGFLVGTAVVVVVSIVASLLIRRVTDSLAHVVREADFEQSTLLAMKDAVSAENTGVQTYLITGDAASLDGFNAAHDRFTVAAGLFQSHPADPGDTQSAAQLVELETQFRRLAGQEIDLSREGFPSTAAFHWQTEGQKAEQALTDRLDQLTGLRTRATHQELTNAQHTESTARLVFAPIVALTAVLAFLTAYLMSRSITRRVELLNRTIEGIERGDYDVRLDTHSGDELGRLARSIRAMARALDTGTRQREQLLRERARRNEELGALYDVARTVNQSLDTTEVLRLAVGKLLGYTHMQAGIAFLFDEETGRFRVALTEGLPEEAAAEVTGFCEEDGSQTFLSEAMARDGLTPLDLAGLPIDTGPFQTAVAVPLRAKGNGRGVLVLVTTEELQFTEDQERLVEGLAKQIGTAIEHAWLYSQSRRLATTEERNRLARELHDSVTQSLFSMSMMAQAMPSLIERQPERAAERAIRLSELARGALAEMRMLILELRPSALREMGLVMAIERHIAGFGSREGIETSVCVDGLQRRLPEPQEEALFRIVQEALNNIARHAGASSVSVSLEFEPTDVRLSIVDNGKGMTVPPSGGGFGMISMRERAENLGGRLDVTSRPGEGVRVVATLPAPAPTTSIAG